MAIRPQIRGFGGAQASRNRPERRTLPLRPATVPLGLSLMNPGVRFLGQPCVKDMPISGRSPSRRWRWGGGTSPLPGCFPCRPCPRCSTRPLRPGGSPRTPARPRGRQGGWGRIHAARRGLPRSRIDPDARAALQAPARRLDVRPRCTHGEGVQKRLMLGCCSDCCT
jgi:hypothetical protein